MISEEVSATDWWVGGASMKIGSEERLKMNAPRLIEVLAAYSELDPCHTLTIESGIL